MVQKTFVQLVDDKDGSEAAETILFALDGLAYEIDLNEANAAQLRQDLERWRSAARRVAVTRPRGRRAAEAPIAAKAQQLAQVRQWARENGFKVRDKGRIPQEVQRAYDAAH